MKTVIILLTLTTCSSNSIFEILAKSDSKKCYTCEEDCTQPVVQTCAVNSKCYFKSTRSGTNTTVATKGCLETDSSSSFCDSANEEIASCYTCEGDLCNKYDEDLDLGASRCYVCIDECSSSLAEHDCQEVLTSLDRGPVKAGCMSYEVTTEDGYTISKGCIVDSLEVRTTCASVGILYPEIKCNFCETDLCNGKNEAEEKYVDECYTCSGLCEDLGVQNCREALGEETKSKCIALEVPPGLGFDSTRGCVEVNSTVQSTCDYVNQVLGGTCKICDTNLCNGHEEEEKYVDECYFCEGTCEGPLEVQRCEEALGPGAKSKCIALDIPPGLGYDPIKSCVEVNTTIQTACDFVNQAMIGNCTICDTNLCNGEGKGEDGDGDGEGEGDGDGDEEKYVDECYSCYGFCEDPEIENCKETLGEDAQSKCIAIEGYGHHLRGCVIVNETVEALCNYFNVVGSSCTICDTNLCNAKPEKYVDECYFCQGTCEGPLEIQQCEDVLGPNARSKCIAIENNVVVNGVSIKSFARGCREVNETLQSVCDYVNHVLGGNCTICDTNLCNGIEENYTDQCYFCDGTCKNPMEVHQCDAVLGPGARSKCIAIEIVEDGVPRVERKCVEVDGEVQRNCNQVNQGGGNCTICDTSLCNGASEKDDDGGGGSSAERVYFGFYILLGTIVFIKFV